MKTALTKLRNLTPIQRKYYADDVHRFIVTTAGRRARKTLIATRKILLQALTTVNGRFFHAAPTHAQARAIFWDHKYNSIWRNTKDVWARPPRESEPLTVYLVSGSEISIHSLEKPSRLEGHPWDAFHVTEMGAVRDCRRVWDSHLRPLLADTGGNAILDGRPDMHSQGAGQYREMVEHACGGAIPRPEPGIGAFASNPDDPEWGWYGWLSADVLDPAEIERIRQSADPKLFAQEYEGSFQTLTGAVYDCFAPLPFPTGNLDKDAVYSPDEHVYIGMDFNVSPMSAVCGHVRSVEKQNHVFLYRGYFMRDSNTRQLAERIVAEHADSKVFYLTPCQSSSSRQTVADIGITDIRILRDVFARADKVLRVVKRTKNPLVKDRIAATNAMLYHKRLHVNPADAGLKELQADWASLTWKEGTSDLDLTDKMRGHIASACDYLLERHFPVLLPKLGYGTVDIAT